MASSLLSRRLCMIIILATALLWLPSSSNTTNNSNIALVQAAGQLNNINATTQQTDSTTTRTITTPQLTTIYQSTVDGFRIGVPEGWVVEDTDNTSPTSLYSERQLGLGILAILCPQSQASQDINGAYSCPSEGTTDFRIMRFAELKTRPEFANATAVVPNNNNNNNRTIAISDFLTFVSQFVGKIFGWKNVQIARTNDVTVNVIDPQINQTVATAPANRVFLTYNLTDESGRDLEAADLDMAVLSNDTNTGYLIVPTFLQSSVVGTQTPEETGRQIGQLIDEMFESFELLSTPPTTTAQPQQ
jgi:hypothetical protein